MPQQANGQKQSLRLLARDLDICLQVQGKRLVHTGDEVLEPFDVEMIHITVSGKVLKEAKLAAIIPVAEMRCFNAKDLARSGSEAYECLFSEVRVLARNIAIEQDRARAGVKQLGTEVPAITPIFIHAVSGVVIVPLGLSHSDKDEEVPAWLFVPDHTEAARAKSAKSASEREQRLDFEAHEPKYRFVHQ
jgi:hypothetical protein